MDKATTLRTVVAITLFAVCASMRVFASVGVNAVPLYGEYVEGSPITVAVQPDSGTLDCSIPPVVTQAGSTVMVTVYKTAIPTPPVMPCPGVTGVSIGAFPVGRHTIVGRVYDAGGAAFVEGSKTLDVMPLEGRCARDPTINPSGLIVQLKPGQTLDGVRERLASDPAFAASLGNPTVHPSSSGYVGFGYPPLDDLTVETARVIRSGAFASAGQDRWICFSPPPMDQVGKVVEFYNARLDHYFYTSSDDEIAAIEAGRVGPDWTLTGQAFYADVQPGCRFMPDGPVYRFAGIPGTGPNSHFFTIDRAECHVVDKSGEWMFEGLPFWASPLSQDGTCPRSDMLVLHRVWRPFGDSNHRFTTDVTIVAAMLDQGWVVEGPAMCVRKPSQ